MPRLLIIGCGDIALRVVSQLDARWRIYALSRNPAQYASLRSLGIIPVAGDLDRLASLRRLAGLAEYVLHFAPPPNHGGEDSRTRHLLAALGKSKSLPQHLIYISTSGVYGDCAGALVSETHPINPKNPRAIRRADAERRLRAWGKRRGVMVSILRTPGIYAAPDRLPLRRLQTPMPVLRPQDDVYTNHIHADDLARIAITALYRGKPGRVYNASDDGHLKMGEYFDLIADHFHIPRPPRIARAEAGGRMPESLLSFMNESRRIVNTRIKRELGVALIYPDVREALRESKGA